MDAWQRIRRRRQGHRPRCPRLSRPAAIGLRGRPEFHLSDTLDAEAKAYLAHPVLGPRLVECAEAALGVEGKTANQIFGSPDDLKLKSCATLFAIVSPEGSVFHRLLDRYFQGERDEKTLQLVGHDPGAG
ncbi:MAG: DUF1810 family protein [Isosphaeraceae bacterium]